MNHGVQAGYDLVYVPEFRRLLRPAFIARAYTPYEAALAGRAFDPAVYFAARWAAKEAAYKAMCDLAASLGLPLDGLATFRDYEVVRREGTPVPALRFHGEPRRLLEALEGCHTVSASLSLTDEHDYAGAFVVLSCTPLALPIGAIGYVGGRA